MPPRSRAIRQSHPARTIRPEAGLARTRFAPEGYRLEDSVGYLLKLAFTGLRRDLDERMAQHELTGVQMLPLLLIDWGACRTAAELARINDSDAGATTRLLDRLQAKGLLLRRRSASDRRVIELGLTPAGQALAEKIPRVIEESIAHALRDFGADEVELLRALLRRLIANVEAEGGPGARHGASARASRASARTPTSR